LLKTVGVEAPPASTPGDGGTRLLKTVGVEAPPASIPGDGGTVGTVGCPHETAMSVSSPASERRLSNGIARVLDRFGCGVIVLKTRRAFDILLNKQLKAHWS